jgi:hypothetical protein
MAKGRESQRASVEVRRHRAALLQNVRNVVDAVTGTRDNANQRP